MHVLKQASLALATEKNEPNQPIYVEFSGTRKDGAPQGGYNGTAVLYELQRYDYDLPASCSMN